MVEVTHPVKQWANRAVSRMRPARHGALERWARFCIRGFLRRHPDGAVLRVRVWESYDLDFDEFTPLCRADVILGITPEEQEALGSPVIYVGEPERGSGVRA